MKTATLFVAMALAASAQTNRKVIPYIAQDQYSITWIHVVNACSRTVSYEVGFEGADGQPEAFSFENNEGVWGGIAITEMAARANHFWAIPKTAPGTTRTGYAVIEDDGDGCVSFDMAYGEEVDAGDMRVALGFVNETSSAGVVQPFINSTGCDTRISVVGSGDQVSIDATDWMGNSLGRSDLGRVHYGEFRVNEKFPRAARNDGLIQITGGNVTAIGFIVCDDRLIWSRRSYPVPGAGDGTNRPGPSSSEYKVEDFAARRVNGTPLAVGLGAIVYSYRLTLRNPTNQPHLYGATLVFRDQDGFALDTAVIPQSPFSVSAGRSRTLEGIVGDPGKGQRQLAARGTDHVTVTIDVER